MRFSKRRAWWLVGIAAAVAVSGAGVVALLYTRPATITIDMTAETGQVFDGWEATADLADDPTQPMPYHDALLQHLADDVGINRLRLEVRAGAEDDSRRSSRFIAGEFPYETYKQSYYDVVNDNDDPMVIDPDGFDFAELDWHIETTVLPLREKLAERGERLIVNLCYVAFVEGWYLHRDPEEYAEFVLATYQHVNGKYGFVPDLWEVILEPDLIADSWTGKEIGHAMVATARRLEAHGFTPAFVAPSVTNAANAVPYFEAIAKVPGALDNLRELSYHRYEGASRRNIARIGRTAEAHGLTGAMLELWFGRATYEVLHEDLDIGRNSGWQGQVVRSHSDFEGRVDGWPQFRMRETVRYKSEYFRAIRHGARRIEASTGNPLRIAPLAFVHDDGRVSVLIKARGAAKLVVNGLPEGEYAISYAVAAGSERLETPMRLTAGEALVTRIPAAGVLAVTGR